MHRVPRSGHILHAHEHMYVRVRIRYPLTEQWLAERSNESSASWPHPLPVHQKTIKGLYRCQLVTRLDGHLYAHSSLWMLTKHRRIENTFFEKNTNVGPLCDLSASLTALIIGGNYFEREIVKMTIKCTWCIGTGFYFYRKWCLISSVWRLTIQIGLNILLTIEYWFFPSFSRVGIERIIGIRDIYDSHQIRKLRLYFLCYCFFSSF